MFYLLHGKRKKKSKMAKVILISLGLLYFYSVYKLKRLRKY